MTIRFDLEDMRWYADRHRGKNVLSGPYWSLVIRFPVLFDEVDRLTKALELIRDEQTKHTGDWCRRIACETLKGGEE